MFQNGNAPYSPANQQVADGRDSSAGQNSGNLNSANVLLENEVSIVTADAVGEPDIVELVLDLQTGQVLKSGLSFQEPAVATGQVDSAVDLSIQPGWRDVPVGQRKLMEELLPTRRQKTPTWTSLLF